MIPIDCKITDFSSYFFVYFYENIILAGKFAYTDAQKRKAGARLKDYLLEHT